MFDLLALFIFSLETYNACRALHGIFNTFKTYPTVPFTELSSLLTQSLTQDAYLLCTQHSPCAGTPHCCSGAPCGSGPEPRPVLCCGAWPAPTVWPTGFRESCRQGVSWVLFSSARKKPAQVGQRRDSGHGEDWLLARLDCNCKRNINLFNGKCCHQVI